MKHPGHTYGGFVPSISERGMTWDIELESIVKLLLVFKVHFLMQYDCLMSCNMSNLYVSHQKKSSPNIDGICIVGGKVALIPVVSSNKTILCNRG
jgi:hypothetical protein